MNLSNFNPTSAASVRRWLLEQGIRPQKRRGQNFLVDQNTLQRIVQAAELPLAEPVLEIGAGLGALTLALAQHGALVTAVEIESRFAPPLQAVASRFPNVRLVFGDFLRLPIPTLVEEDWGEKEKGTVVANIPYAITTPILERLLAHKTLFRRMVLLVQEEFARRAIAAPNTPEYGALSLFVQYHTHAAVKGKVPRTVFWPQPEVDSAILVLDSVANGTQPVRDEQRLFALVRAAFGQRRKTLLRALLAASPSLGVAANREVVLSWLERAHIAPQRRGETLSLEEFVRLTEASLQGP